METNSTTYSVSGSNFLQLLKSDWLINKGTYLKFTLATIGIFIAIAIFISINAVDSLSQVEVTESHVDVAIGSDEIHQNFDFTIENQYYNNLWVRKNNVAYMLAFSFWVFCVGLTVFGSLTFSNLSDKRHRISTFMIPASMSDKFLLRGLIYFIGGTLLLIIGFVMGLIVLQIAFGGGSVFLDMLANDFLEEEYSGYIVAVCSLALLFSNSIYTLGSAYWPKLSWIKTWIVLMVVEWIIGIILISGLLSGIDMEAFFRWLKDIDFTVVQAAWIFISILIISNAACWWLAWRRFRSTQIVQRFMRK